MLCYKQDTPSCANEAVLNFAKKCAELGINLYDYEFEVEVVENSVLMNSVQVVPCEELRLLLESKSQN